MNQVEQANLQQDKWAPLRAIERGHDLHDYNLSGESIFKALLK